MNKTNYWIFKKFSRRWGRPENVKKLSLITSLSILSKSETVIAAIAFSRLCLPLSANSWVFIIIVFFLLERNNMKYQMGNAFPCKIWRKVKRLSITFFTKYLEKSILCPLQFMSLYGDLHRWKCFFCQKTIWFDDNKWKKVKILRITYLTKYYARSSLGFSMWTCIAEKAVFVRGETIW